MRFLKNYIIPFLVGLKSFLNLIVEGKDKIRQNKRKSWNKIQDKIIEIWNTNK